MEDRYGILFDSVKIGPVTAPNRFYQVPHCTGMGHRYPRSEARLRGIKAEGGWGVVSTQETEIHPSSDITPYNEGRLWDETDIPALKLVTDSIHAHGSLAAIQLVHNGLHASNRYSRITPLAPSHCAVDTDDPLQARAMSLSDIDNFRRWHVQAANRAMQAGFDIIYVYAGHDMSLLQHFLLSRHNHRTDRYGGSFDNRLRLFREVIADTREAVSDRCAVAVRFAIDELLGSDGIQHQGEGRDIIQALAEEPDLWDINLSDWSNDSQTSRFSEEGFQESYTGWVKSLTSKPVVGVGRYTSPDKMIQLIKKGHLDFIGAARPSIADPFMPEKIRQGNESSIRECIGCNICTSGDNTSVPMRCTQNPTIGEEWRRDWHPEYIPALRQQTTCLVVGGGPAGLEAARALAQRGAHVTLAEESDHWGGRVTHESSLPGLSAWSRVRDWRLYQLQQMSNVELYLHSHMQLHDVLEQGSQQVVLATGAHWRHDGVGRAHRLPVDGLHQSNVITPDDVFQFGDGCLKDTGPVVVFDDERFYLGSVLADWVVKQGRECIYVTPSPLVSPWSEHTLEQHKIQSRLISLGVTLCLSHKLASVTDSAIDVQCVYSGIVKTHEAKNLLLVTSRLPSEQLWLELEACKCKWRTHKVENVMPIGDCLAPGIIANAVYSGYQCAMSLDLTTNLEPKREDQLLHTPM